MNSAYDLFPTDKGFFIGRKRVTGIFQTGRRLAIRNNTEPGDELTLIRDYGNKFDERAVRVRDRYGGDVGFIEAKSNDEIAFYMDSGCECIAVVADLDKKSATVGMLVDVFCRCDAVSMERLAASYQEYMRSQITF